MYEKLFELICDGTLEPGERLDERALAASLGVSRTPIREAVTRLLSDGLVEHRPYQGNSVRCFNARQIADLYDVRRALEVLAIREAVPRLTSERLAEIRHELGRACDALESGDMGGFADADRAFHRLIVRTSENETLIETLHKLEAQVQLVRTTANRDPQLVARTVHERDAILAALEARDVDRAAALASEHIDQVKRTVVAQLEGDDA